MDAEVESVVSCDPVVSYFCITLRFMPGKTTKKQGVMELRFACVRSDEHSIPRVAKFMIFILRFARVMRIAGGHNSLPSTSGVRVGQEANGRSKRGRFCAQRIQP